MAGRVSVGEPVLFDRYGWPVELPAWAVIVLPTQLDPATRGIAEALVYKIRRQVEGEVEIYRPRGRRGKNDSW